MVFTSTTTYGTEYLTSDVYTTETCYESFYTTISAGSTITLATTITKVVEVTSKYTITATYEPPTTKATVYVPITQITSVPEYETVTYPTYETATGVGPTIIVTASFKTTASVPSLSTVIIPQKPTTITTTPAVNSTTTAPTSTTSAPLQVTGNAGSMNKPVVWFAGAGMAVLAAI